MPEKLLKCGPLSKDFERKLLSRFTLSDALYDIRPGTLSQDSKLLALPIEILAMIFEEIDHAPSQITLALSCKRMAFIAKDLKLNLSLTSPKYAGFLPVSVFDVPALMRLLSAWMPPQLRLCDHCLTARPCAQDYWTDVTGCEVSNFWITKTGWTFSNAVWHKQEHNICPACHIGCSLSDFVDCDGCRALGRLGDVDWERVSDSWRRRTAEEMQADHWSLSA